MIRGEKQLLTTKFMVTHPRGFVHNDPGTGKTIATIDAYAETKKGRMLVFAPLSILQPSWGNDIEKVGGLSYAVAHGTAKKREAAMLSGADIVITNHDAVNWVVKDKKRLLAGFSHCAVDEYSAYKNRSAQRSKALQQITNTLEYLWLLNGTPGAMGLTDIWFPALLADRGMRLGTSFWAFRSQVCRPVQNGPRAEHIEWVDRPEAIVEVADKLKDITIRFTLDECEDMPENIVTTMMLDMPAWVKAAYDAMLDEAMLEVGDSKVTAIHAGAKAQKLCQILSGAVYNQLGDAVRIHSDRYDLVADLIESREQCVVAYNYKHEIEGLTDVFNRRGISYGIINGDASKAQREKCVEDFQAGKLRVCILHPQSGAHGLTLTAGTTTIWTSPPKSADWYIQLNARIHRKGQKRRTETIQIAYKNSLETKAYERLEQRLDNLHEFLDYMVQFRRTAHA